VVVHGTQPRPCTRKREGGVREGGGGPLSFAKEKGREGYQNRRGHVATAIREKGAREERGKCSPFPRVGLERGEKKRYGGKKKKEGVSCCCTCSHAPILLMNRAMVLRGEVGCGCLSNGVMKSFPLF
jgi:hypothetical protein